MTPGMVEERVAVLERAFEDHVKHHSDVHEMEENALQLRTSDLERRLLEMNQFRDQISSERLMYITREVYDQRHEDLVKRISIIERDSSNLQGRLVVVGAAVSIVVSLVVVAVNIAVRLWK